MAQAHSLGFGSIGAAYMGIGTRFDNSARIVVITNLTDALMVFSINGVDDHFLLPAKSKFNLTLTWNTTLEDRYHLEAENRVYVRSDQVPTKGSVYVSQIRAVEDS